MYDIPIDDTRYHINGLNKTELLWGESTYRRILKRYPDLKDFINTTLSPLHLDKLGTQTLLRDITLAFCHEIKLSKPQKSQEQMDKTVKGWLYSFLPIIVENLTVTRYSHLVQFEPIPAVCLYLSTTVLRHIVSSQNTATLSEFESYTLTEVVGFFRVLRSSLALFFIGDDVHGISLYRGALEILAKLTLADHFAEEYVLFKKFNAHLQLHKANGEPLPQEMTNYLKGEPAYKKSPENFLAYGWAKNSDGKRLLTMKDLIRAGLKNEIKLLPLLQIVSEFVHEDYVGINYDYVSIRKAMIDHYYILLKVVYSDEITDKLLPQKEQKKIRHLQALADPIYAGEIPLSQLE